MASEDNEELLDREEELMGLFKEIDSITSAAKKFKGRERMNQIDIVRDRINRAKQVLKGYKGLCSLFI